MQLSVIISFIFVESKNGGKSESIRRMVDITRDKPIKVSIRVAVPVRDHPKVCTRDTSFKIRRRKCLLCMF